jgi:hypothetical protein
MTASTNDAEKVQRSREIVLYRQNCPTQILRLGKLSRVIGHDRAL